MPVMKQMPTQSLAARIASHGFYQQVLGLESLALPLPAAGEVMLRMLLAPINPADCNVITGNYGKLPKLPATLGNEGLGEVVAVGSGVTIPLGTWLRPLDGIGTWCQYCVAPLARCLRIPQGLSAEQAALLTTNPGTAWCVLEEFMPLKPGAVVLCNAPTSAVGRAFIALGHARGLRVGCLARRAEDIGALCAQGAEAVVVEGRQAHRQLLAAMGPAALALNMVGGESAQSLAKSLQAMGYLITIGAMAREPLTLANGPMIFGELRSIGFWISRWFERAAPERITQMLEDCAKLMRSGILRPHIAARFALADIHAALQLLQQEARPRGTVLLDLQASVGP